MKSAQRSLWDQPPQQPPLARATDTDGSHAAARRHAESGKLSGNRKVVLEGLKKHPGNTSKELGHLIGMDRHEAARRLADLQGMGLAEKCGVRQQTKEATWRAK